MVKSEAKRNYKLAIPQYYSGNVQLLLPIKLEDYNKDPDVALVIYKEGDRYVGKTCLTLDMAYNNARLISKPVHPNTLTWLKPL